MLDYFLVCLFIGLNLVIYLLIHVFLEINYHKTPLNNIKVSSKPKAWNNQIQWTFTLLPSLYLWLLFILIPISAFFEGNLFYGFNPLPLSQDISDLVQIIGLALIIIGTVLAILGRIARGIYAISWGIPQKIVKKGIFKYIRHPLYGSYYFYFIGFQLTFLSLIMAPLLFGLIGYYMSAIYEESVLVEIFGDDYKDYMSKTTRFLPFLW